MWFKKSRKPVTAQQATPYSGDQLGAPSYYGHRFQSMGARRSNNAADFVTEFPNGPPLGMLMGAGIPFNRQYHKLPVCPPIPVQPRMTLSGPGVEVAQQFLLAPLSLTQPEAGGYGL